MPSPTPSIDTLLAAAVEIAAPAERCAYLDDACQGDTALRQRLDKLIANHFAAGSFLEQSPLIPSLTAIADADPIGSFIGPFELVERLGEGGMGIVYLAEQAEPVRRQVALKVIKPGMGSAEVIARFEAERQALAMMDHPNIAKVLDAGTFNDRPYFVMELVRGIPITEYCDGACFTVRQRLAVFIDACRAVQHAHTKGIIHRDLKPSNILVTSHDGRPVVKIIDFGVVKALGRALTDHAIHTGFAQIIGTPLYMSPEQAEFNELGVDTRSDVYALGVLLYELLTGQTPFDPETVKSLGFDELRRMIREDEPPAPSRRLSTLAAEKQSTISQRRGVDGRRLSNVLRGELDWIVMRALEKDRTRRYESASAFADDVQRYLNDEPVQAGPASTGYRLRKFVRRNRAVVVAATAVLLVLTLGAAGTTAGLVRSERLRGAVERESNEKSNALIRLEEQQKATKAAVIHLEEQQKATKAALDAQWVALTKAAQTLDLMSDEYLGRRLSRQPYLSPEDKAFMRKLIAQYEALAATRGEDVHGRWVRAMGYFRVGALRAKLGPAAEAVAAYRTARDLFKGLVNESPMFHRELTRTHNNLGLALEPVGELDEALAEHKAALDGWAVLLAESPDDEESWHFQAAGQASLARIMALRGDHKGAEAGYVTALASNAELIRRHPAPPLYRQNEASWRVHRADALRRLNRLDDALAELQQAGMTYEGLEKELKSRKPIYLELARYHHSLGELLEVRSGIPAALNDHRAAVSEMKRLVADYPSVPQFRVEQAMFHDVLGIALRKLSRLEEAEAELRQAVELGQRLNEEHPGVAAYGMRYGGSCCNLGNLLSSRKQVSESLEWFDRAVKTLAAVVERNPQQPYAGQFLLYSYWGRANALSMLGRHADALADCDRVRTVDGPVNHYSTLRHALSLAYIDPPKAVAEARMAATKVPKVSVGSYLAACAHAVAAGKTTDAARREEYGAAAVRYLVDAGAFLHLPSNMMTMKSESHLDPIRQRDDFKKFLADLERPRS